MKTIRLTKMDKDKIIKILIAGGILAFPTDTVFGLGCMMDEKAMTKIYEAKGRSFNKPLPMMCDSLTMIEEYAQVNEDARKIIERFTPGALTVVFKKKEELPDYVTNGFPTIGIRVPEDSFILDLIATIGKPLMVTSANISGEPSLRQWKDVYDCLKGKIDGIVCEDALADTASTIIDVSEEEIKVLREGQLGISEIMEVLQ
ncbi:MAG: threonylcarbamoyl-AMP synthase [Erysipelotrichaceae bacterium]|nr:threonylcarbamoyl-AMP synthase [Erysipelotrichaceae bacterium]